MDNFLLNERNDNNDKTTSNAMNDESILSEDDVYADIPSFRTNQTLASMMDMLKELQVTQTEMKQQQVDMDIKLTAILALLNKPDSEPRYQSPPTMTDPPSFSQMSDFDIRDIRRLDELLQKRTIEKEVTITLS